MCIRTIPRLLSSDHARATRACRPNRSASGREASEGALLGKAQPAELPALKRPAAVLAAAPLAQSHALAPPLPPAGAAPALSARARARGGRGGRVGRARACLEPRVLAGGVQVEQPLRALRPLLAHGLARVALGRPARRTRRLFGARRRQQLHFVFVFLPRLPCLPAACRLQLRPQALPVCRTRKERGPGPRTRPATVTPRLLPRSALLLRGPTRHARQRRGAPGAGRGTMSLERLYRVWAGLVGFRVPGLGFRVQGSGFRVQGIGPRWDGARLLEVLRCGAELLLGALQIPLRREVRPRVPVPARPRSAARAARPRATWARTWCGCEGRCSLGRSLPPRPRELRARPRTRRRTAPPPSAGRTAQAERERTRPTPSTPAPRQGPLPDPRAVGRARRAGARRAGWSAARTRVLDARVLGHKFNVLELHQAPQQHHHPRRVHPAAPPAASGAAAAPPQHRRPPRVRLGAWVPLAGVVGDGDVERRAEVLEPAACPGVGAARKQQLHKAHVSP
jgi:hypothetical protein